MASRANFVRSILSALVACTAILSAAAFFAPPVLAGSTGTLKLKVWSCQPAGWLSDARVDVQVIRPGVGQVDSDSDYTDGSGYVEFTFEDLEDADEAHVTVSNGGEPDGGHVYNWVESDGRRGEWDLGYEGGDSLCVDDWYDQGANIIKCATMIPPWSE